MIIILILLVAIALIAGFIFHQYKSGGNKRKKFIADNRVYGDKHKLLTLGAIIIDMNDATSYVMNIRIGKDESRELLINSWGIEDRESFDETIDWLLDEEGDHNDGDQIIRVIRSGKPYRAYDNLVDDASRNGMSSQLFESCKSTIAWDIERACFLARMSAHIGYITEGEAYNIIENRAIPVLKEQGFNSWEEYAASFMMGRTLCYGGEAHEVLFQIKDLLYNRDEKSIWQDNLIRSL